MADLYLHGVGHFHPDTIIDNAFLESLDIGTTHEWIMERVGIEQRRTVLPLDYIRQTRNQDSRAAKEAATLSNAQTGQKAAELALQHAAISADQIGLVIAGSCSPDYVTPAEACTIAGLLNIDAPGIDLNSACSSFGAQMHFLAMMAPEQMPDYVLLVIPENNTRTIDYTDRSTAVLWGDGTFACVVSKHPARAKISHTTLHSNPKKWTAVQIPRVGHFQQEGRAVQNFAIRQSVQCFKALQEANPGQTLHYIGHQANLTMLQSVQNRCALSDDLHFYNINQFGNTGAAGAPTVLSQNWQKLQNGDAVGLVVVGAGLTWASMKIEFMNR